MKRKNWIIGIILAFVLLIGGGYAYFEFDRISSAKKAMTDYEVSAQNVVKSNLEMYYSFYQKYPSDTDELIEGLSNKKNYEILNQKPLDLSSLKRTIGKESNQYSWQELKEFSYSVRGDRQAYKFSYTDQYGKRKVIEGSYQKDFHEGR